MGRLIRILCLAVGLLALAACSVPTDDNPQVFRQDELPENLQQRTTTTTTTTLPDDIREVTYYLLVAPDDQTQRKVAPYKRPLPFTDVLDPLIRPMFDPDFASGEDAEGLINVVTQFEFVTVTRNDSPVATVELTADEENLPGEQVLRDTAAQLVWTLTQFLEVDSVQIIINGDLEPLPTDDGRSDEPVTTDDYRFYDVDFTPEQVTTTAAPSTTTSSIPVTTTTQG